MILDGDGQLSRLADAIAQGRTLADVVTQIASLEPLRVAAVDRGQAVTYQALCTAMASRAQELAAAGFTGADFVGISVSDELPNLVTTLALIQIGCAHICLPSFEPAEWRQSTATRLGLHAVIVDKPALALPPFPCWHLTDGWSARPAQPRIAPRVAVAPATVVFTSSGTTGKPKLIPIPQATLLASAAQYRDWPETMACFASNEHNGPRRQQLRVLARAGCVVMSNTREGCPAYRLAERHGVTDMLMTAFIAQSVLSEVEHAGIPGLALDGVRLWLTGSRIGQSLRERVTQRLSPLLSVVYGSIECLPLSRAEPRDLHKHPDTIGYPMPRVQVELVDARHQPVAPGVVGRLRAKSPGCFPGYLDDEPANQRCFHEGWYYPGDSARWGEDGMLIFHGRSDDMMILNSINIFPGEIEAAVETYPGVRECSVFPSRSGLHGEIPILAVVRDAGLDTQALLAFCRARLGNKAPRKVFEVETLPRNPSGKVLKAALLEMFDKRGQA